MMQNNTAGTPLKNLSQSSYKIMFHVQVFQKVRRMINSTLVGIALLVPASNIAYSSKE
jgi:hypothetical protein